jgi:hypothetical protein
VSKYKGKYGKCRTCTHIKNPDMDVFNVLVFPQSTCPNPLYISDLNGCVSDKRHCQQCNQYTEKEPTSAGTDTDSYK